MEPEKAESRSLPMLTGSNYLSWKIRMLTLLDEHELMDCIERELEQDPNLLVVRGDDDANRAAKSRAQEKRKRRNKRCKSMLIERIHDSQLEHVADCKTPKEIWDKLVKVFERKSAASRMSLKMQLLDLRYKGGSLRDHFLTFDRIVRALKGTGSKMDELDVMCHLLLTMRSTAYATVVTTLETMPEEQLSLEFVQCRLLDEEIKRGKGVELVTPKREPAAFVGKPSVKKWKCFACGQVGHKAADCPEKEEKQCAKKGVKKEKKKGNANMTEEKKEEKKSVCFVADECRENKNKVLWFADSGASEHMSNDRSLFESMELLDEAIEIAVALSGKTATAKYSGTIKMIGVANGEESECVLKKVLYAPSLRCNLFSIRKVEMAGMEVVFKNGAVKVLKGSEVVACGKRNGCQYEMEFYPPSEQTSSMYSCGKIKKNFELWHRRFGHLGAKNLEKIVQQEMVEGIKKCGSGDEIVYCEPCIEAKQTRKPFEDGPGRRSKRVLEIVHTDVCGPITPDGHDGSRYYVSFIDDWSRFVILFTMESKDQVFEYFELYEAMVTAKFGVNISCLRCDNGGEYRNKNFEEFCRRKGIQMQFTVPYTPEQNGVSERFNRTAMEKARSMLFDAQVDSKFWCEAVETAAYLVNRSPASAIEEGKTPFELWEGRKPDVSAMKVWGSPAYCHVPKENRKKLDRKTWKGIFLGYHCNGYRIWDPDTETVVAMRDVVVDESAKVAEIQKSTVESSDDGVVVFRRHDSDDEEDGPDVDLDQSVLETGETAAGEAAPPVPVSPAERTPGRPVRAKTAPQWHDLYEMNYAAYALNATSFVDNFPDTLEDLKKRDDWEHWQVAVNEEMLSHQKNKTWTVTKLPEGRKPITCKWIFKIKRSGSGEVDRYKARLVARGFSQRYGFDYLETYSPVAKMDSVRMLLAVANQQRFEVHQMDVKTAFLNGTLQEEIYMVPPEGLQVKPGFVCRLNRALYGLKQASRTWNDRFHKFVLELGFARSENDPCLYVKGEKGQQLFLLLYVDDILIGSKHKRAILEVKAKLAKEFEMSDLGEVSSFLGMAIERDMEKRTMRISQKQYLEGLLRRFAMDDCKPAATPLECHLKLKKGEEAERTSKPYRELVGCLNYVSQTTRPDLCAAVNLFSQYQNCPTDQHWSYLKRVLRYVKGTLDIGLEFKGGDNVKELVAYCDADWGNDVNDRRSISGYVFRIFGGTVAWQTRKQQSVALSSTEAEFVALCNAACEGVWLRRLLEDFGVVIGGAVTYFEDNQSCIMVAEEPRDSRRMKHVDIKFNFIRELIQEEKISVKYIPTDQQLADIMTKGLPSAAFARLRDELGLKSSRN